MLFDIAPLEGLTLRSVVDVVVVVIAGGERAAGARGLPH
jgi:hypothetical protein